mgnify:CR=1 FL=1
MLLFNFDHDWRVPSMHQHQIHQQSRCPTVAVVERMYGDKFVVRYGSQLDGVKVACLIGV